MTKLTRLDRAIPATGPPEPRPEVESIAETGARRAALIAGSALLLMSGLAAFGQLVVLEGLVTPGDPGATAGDILASEGSFRLAVVSLYAVVVLDVLVAWALLRVFNPVDRDLSRLAAWFRLAYSAVFLVALSQLAGIPRLLSDPGYADVFTPEQIQGEVLLKVDTFNDIWSAAFVLFGVHLVLLGLLAYRSGFVPRFIAVLLVVAGAGYAFDGLAAVLAEEPVFAVSTVTFLGEFLLAVWLVFRNRRISFTRRSHAL